MNLKPIAYIRTDFPEKFGIPRQSGLVDSLQGCIVFEPAFRNPDSLRGLEEFSHLWLIWEFSANVKRNLKSSESVISQSIEQKWQPTVRPPRLGGNKAVGVFATRSPFRPNPIGLSCVEIVSIVNDSSDGPLIHVRGADLMDGTPIYDIKPYISYADSRPHARCGYVDSLKEPSLKVVLSEEFAANFPDRSKLPALVKVLSLDPRPSYQDDPGRVYGLAFAGANVLFKVDGSILTVVNIE